MPVVAGMLPLSGGGGAAAGTEAAEALSGPDEERAARPRP